MLIIILQYSGITVESGTQVKSVKITLNIFAVYQKIGDLFCPVIFLDFRTVCVESITLDNQGLVLLYTLH